jgi:DNA helicase-2/ATP-dependent DNA helicase PcrA
MHDLARKRRVPMTEAARLIVESDELKPKPRGTLRGLIESFDRWRKQKDTLPHTELAEIVLDESGYTEMWQKDRSADAAGRLENLKELVRSMEEFENLSGFLEHISLVMDTDRSEGEDAVNVMTLHAAKGLEFDTVFLPGWEEGLFPSQRTLDDQGRLGLEEERRLAHVALTRARRRLKIYFAANRRMHGMWSSNIPSRFLDELPEAHVEVQEAKGGFASGMSAYGNAGGSRFDEMTHFGSGYSTPGWQRAQARGKSFSKRDGAFEEEDASQDYESYDSTDMNARSGSSRSSTRSGPSRGSSARDASATGASPPPLRGRVREGGASGSGGPNFSRDAARRRGPLTIEGELVAKSTGAASAFTIGDRVFHQKFGNGNVVNIDGNKLTIAFDKAGEKRVVDSFVERA